MTIRHLKLFLAVYRTENVTKAAEALHMTQPTVTRAIQELEGYYGVRLFDRINRHLTPTEAGHRFYRHAAQTVEAFDRMEKGMHDWGESGVLRIGATQGIGSVLVPQVIPAFRKKYPNFTVKSLICNSAALQQALEANELDFALTEGGLPGDHFKTRTLGKDRLVLLLPPGHPLAEVPELCLSDLRDMDFLLREQGSQGRRFVDEVFSAHGLPLNPVMESASTHALVQAVHAGLGAAILPEELVWHSIESGFVATNTLTDVPLFRNNYIVWHEGKFLTTHAKELMRLCAELYKSE